MDVHILNNLRDIKTHRFLFASDERVRERVSACQGFFFAKWLETDFRGIPEKSMTRQLIGSYSAYALLIRIHSCGGSSPHYWPLWVKVLHVLPKLCIRTCRRAKSMGHLSGRDSKSPSESQATLIGGIMLKIDSDALKVKTRTNNHRSLWVVSDIL